MAVTRDAANQDLVRRVAVTLLDNPEFEDVTVPEHANDMTVYAYDTVHDRTFALTVRITG